LRPCRGPLAAWLSLLDVIVICLPVRSVTTCGLSLQGWTLTSDLHVTKPLRLTLVPHRRHFSTAGGSRGNAEDDRPGRHYSCGTVYCSTEVWDGPVKSFVS
jgi:hypothetical protein